jgi:hypothetical protein
VLREELAQEADREEDDGDYASNCSKVDPEGAREDLVSFPNSFE